MIDYKKTIPLRLAYYREKYNIKQIDIAKALKITQGTYSNWENGTRTPSIEKIAQIADFYETSIDKLLGRTDINEN